MNTSKASCQKESPSLDNIDCQSKPIILILPWVPKAPLAQEEDPSGNQNYARPTPPLCNYVIPETHRRAVTPTPPSSAASICHRLQMVPMDTIQSQPADCPARSARTA
jgi:hypothetical protein